MGGGAIWLKDKRAMEPPGCGYATPKKTVIGIGSPSIRFGFRFVLIYKVQILIQMLF